MVDLVVSLFERLWSVYTRFHARCFAVSIENGCTIHSAGSCGDLLNEAGQVTDLAGLLLPEASSTDLCRMVIKRHGSAQLYPPKANQITSQQQWSIAVTQLEEHAVKMSQQGLQVLVACHAVLCNQ